jgi:hypothetical protein
VEDRPSNDVLNNNYATWLPFSETQPHARHLMILRTMLGDEFPNSTDDDFHCRKVGAPQPHCRRVSAARLTPSQL